MKNIFDVLKEKEASLRQIQNDIDALRAAARLLAEEGDPQLESLDRLAATGTTPEAHPKGSALGVARSRQFP